MSLAKNSLLYLISNICIKATSFFLLPLYSNLITPDIYGHIYVVSALSNFMIMFLPLSMFICISRFYFECKNLAEIKTLYSTIVWTVLIISTILITPCFFWSRNLSTFLKIPHHYFLIGLITSFFNIFYQIILALLYVCEKAKKVSITSTCLGIFQIILQLFLVIYMSDKGFALLLTMLIQAVTTFIIFLIFSKPYLLFILDTYSLKRYIKYSLSQFPSDISSWLVNFTDRILINKYINSSAAGIYGIGTNIGQIPMMIFTSMNSAFTPYVNSQYKAIETADKFQKDILKQQLSNIFLITSSILLMLITILIVLTNNIINLLNPLYSDTFGIIIVMLLTSLMNSYRCMYMAPLTYNISYTKIKSLIWVLVGILNIGLNIVLIPRYGIYAACFNSLFAYTLTFLMMLYFGKKAFKIKYNWYSLIKILIISICFCPLIFIGADIKFLFIKLLLALPYIYICFKYVLNINLIKIIKNHVKIFYYK